MTKSNRTIMNLIICISEILIGVLLLIDPVGFTSAVLMILGIALMILGAWKTVSYFRTSPEAAAQNGGLVVGIVCAAGCILRISVGMVSGDLSGAYRCIWSHYTDKRDQQGTMGSGSAATEAAVLVCFIDRSSAHLGVRNTDPDQPVYDHGDSLDIYCSYADRRGCHGYRNVHPCTEMIPRVWQIFKQDCNKINFLDCTI